ncbi:ubiquitin-conjugating enzyme E2 19-like [Rosa rugosa]|uniref:ubiquitin-conjugating enzyme E2 19-like n=1 Tax=Rosa rugosa TaxID=74645 RepID=UPI002B41238B|nr:ubiquitin-conjugating enzyme E2 19-like [Rosa rugosa]
MSSRTVNDLIAGREKSIFTGGTPADPSTITTHDDCYRVHTNRVATVAAASTNQSPPPENSTIKRLQSELKDLMMSDCDSGISAFPEKDNIMCWKGRISGGKGSVYEGKEYRLSLRFPNDYPFKPPCINFDHPIPFHPNVDAYGKIYLDILLLEEFDKWSSAYDVRTVLLSIKSLLEDPNLSTPVNCDAARLWSNQKEYKERVEKLYKHPQYGLEKRTIDRFGGQLCGLREDSKVLSECLRRHSSFIKRKVSKQ